MQNEFISHSLDDAISLAVNRHHHKKHDKVYKNLERKLKKINALAPPFFWGPWTEIWAQYGILGPHSEDHVSYIDISFNTASRAPSTFDVEIKGGDEFIRTVGPGSKRVSVTGNISTSLSIRFKSHSVPLNIDVFVQ